LQKKSILIPTPGQTEQEYLAQQLMHHHLAYCVEQDDFNLEDALTIAKEFAYHLPTMEGNTLNSILQELLTSI
jgi:UDP-N-acetylglucosamine:LPS N-acetylglucosamine transferase